VAPGLVGVQVLPIGKGSCGIGIVAGLGTCSGGTRAGSGSFNIRWLSVRCSPSLLFPTLITLCVCVCVVCSFALLWVLSPPCGLVFPAAGVAVSAGVGALVRLRVAACVVRF
jgi:hypothetical protein